MQRLMDICSESHDASYPQRCSLLCYLSESAKYTISRIFFRVESQAVDFANIFRGTAGERSKWQKLVGAKFLHLAVITYKHRILSKSEADDEEVVETYKN